MRTLLSKMVRELLARTRAEANILSHDERNLQKSIKSFKSHLARN